MGTRIVAIIALVFTLCVSGLHARTNAWDVYRYIQKIQDNIQTHQNTPAQIFISLSNPTGSVVNVTLSLSGDDPFLGFSTSNAPTVREQLQIKLLPNTQAVIVNLHFLSDQIGKFKTMVEVSDGTNADRVEVTAQVSEDPGAFVLFDVSNLYTAFVGDSLTIMRLVCNLTSDPIILSTVLLGDTAFSLEPASSIMSVPAYGYSHIELKFYTHTEGTYHTILAVSQNGGTEMDTASIVVEVVQANSSWEDAFEVTAIGSPELYFSNDAMLTFQVPDSLCRQVRVRNNTGEGMIIEATFERAHSFIIDTPMFMLADGQERVLNVTYTGADDLEADDILWVLGRNVANTSQAQKPVFLYTELPEQTAVSGLEVTPLLDFGLVDSSRTKCLDVVLKNTTGTTISISNITLAGYNEQFFVPDTDPIEILAGDDTVIPVCFYGGAYPFKNIEVLSFQYDNPVNTPVSQIVTVQLRANTYGELEYSAENTCLSAWVDCLPVTSMGSEIEYSIHIENFSDNFITIYGSDVYGASGELPGVFTLETSLPHTISAHDPAMPKSGKSDLIVTYKPVAPYCTAGIQDQAYLLLLLNEAACTDFEMSLSGIPEDSLDERRERPLYPAADESDDVRVFAASTLTTHRVTFSNNLDVPVTISAIEMQRKSHFTLIDVENATLPVTLLPDENLALVFELNAPANDIYYDKLIIHSTYEYLHDAFDLFGIVDGIVPVERLPEAADEIRMVAAPNPSSGQVTITVENVREVVYTVTDIMGRTIMSAQGTPGWRWNGCSVTGVRVQAGTYYLHATGTHEDGTVFSVVRPVTMLE